MNLFKWYKQYRINKQQAIAKEILHRLSGFDNKCMIAGGAPRDWTLGELAKDLDVYLDVKYLDAFVESLPYLGFSVTRIHNKVVLNEGVLSYKCANYLDRVIDCKYKGETVQIMIVLSNTTNSEVLEGFPLSISKISYTRNFGIYQTEDFKKGLQDRTIYNTNSFYDDNHPYIIKINKKFPQWNYVDGTKVQIIVD